MRSGMKLAVLFAGLALGTAAQADEKVTCTSVKGAQGHSVTFGDDGSAVAHLMLPDHPFNGLAPLDRISTEKTQNFLISLATDDDTVPLTEQGFVLSVRPGTETLMLTVTPLRGQQKDLLRCKVPKGWAPR